MGTLRDLIAENDRLRVRAHAAEAAARTARAEALVALQTNSALQAAANAVYAEDIRLSYGECKIIAIAAIAAAIRSLKTATKGEDE